MDFAARMDRLGTETAFEVLGRARELERQGRDVIHLEIGEPDFDTPSNIVEAGIRALRGGATHYTPSAGIDALRAAIARDQSTRKCIDVASENVVVTPGGKPVMFFAMMAILEEGDEVVYPNPGFPIYESMVDYLGAKRVPIGFIEEERVFRWDVDKAIASIGPRTKMVIINSPSNPVGCIIPEDDMRRLAEAVRRHDAWLLSDEIYSRVLYDGNFVSPATFPGMAERTCILDGFSKTYAMTGWRLGYGVMPAELASRVSRLVVNCSSCTATFTQLAGVEALTGPQDAVDAMVAEFKRRRDLVVPGLNTIPGVHCPMPQGAFYAFPDIKRTGMSSREAADALLYEGNVAVLSGTAFGANGEGFLRLSYANSYENLERALERIKSVIERHARVPAS
jgi:aspartate/methionine/tyrosine aminotransferase